VAVEWAGTVALAIEIVLLGLAAFYLPRRTPQGRAADFERRFAALQEDGVRTIKGLKAEVLDVLEREERMFERLRKRAERGSGVEQQTAGNGAPPTFATGADVLAYARSKGLVR